MPIAGGVHFNYKFLRQELKQFLREWEAVAKELVDGIVLRCRSGTLYDSFVKDTSELNRKNPAIILRNTARTAAGFGYAAFHEYYTGKAFIRPALYQMLNPARRYRSARALALDASEAWMDLMVRSGWIRTGAKRIRKDIAIDFATGRPITIGVAEFQSVRRGLNLQI